MWLRCCAWGLLTWVGRGWARRRGGSRCGRLPFTSLARRLARRARESRADHHGSVVRWGYVNPQVVPASARARDRSRERGAFSPRPSGSEEHLQLRPRRRPELLGEVVPVVASALLDGEESPARAPPEPCERAGDRDAGQ